MRQRLVSIVCLLHALQRILFQDGRKHLGATGSLLGLNGGLLTHGSENDDVGVLLLVLEELLNLGANLALGALDVVLHGAVLSHEGEETIVLDVEKLVLATGDVGDVHVVGGRGQLLKLLASEDVDGDQVDLGVTVLASLGGGHVDDLARAALDDDVTVLAESGTLHGEGGRGTRVGGVEGHLMLSIVGVDFGHFD